MRGSFKTLNVIVLLKAKVWSTCEGINFSVSLLSLSGFCFQGTLLKDGIQCNQWKPPLLINLSKGKS